ncbi:hypothetical protein D3C81_1355750 [compost metagenome]
MSTCVPFLITKIKRDSAYSIWISEDLDTKIDKDGYQFSQRQLTKVAHIHMQVIGQIFILDAVIRPAQTLHECRFTLGRG